MAAANWKSRGLGFALSLWLVGCSTVQVKELPPEVAKLDPEVAWKEILKQYVNAQGQVSFEALAQNPSKLKLVVFHIAKSGPKTTPELYKTPEAQLAYHLNSYNALAMYNILDSGLPESLSGLKKVAFFYFRKVIVDGETMSLYAYENDVIRKLEEERVHFALNCMSRGCPRLPQTPFPAVGLNAVLEAQAKEFFNEERNARVDEKAKVVYLSEILNFYTEDFLKKAPSLTAYANKYRKAKMPESYEVKFTPYDWTVNRPLAPSKLSNSAQTLPGSKS